MRVSRIQREGPKDPTSEKEDGVKGTLREGGGGDGGGGEGGVEKERKGERESEGMRGENEGRVGRKRVQRRGRGRHLRAIIIIARHNSAGLSTSAGTDWAIGPRRWLLEGGGRGAPPRMGLLASSEERTIKNDFERRTAHRLKNLIEQPTNLYPICILPLIT